jgi:transposase InsO family protein
LFWISLPGGSSDSEFGVVTLMDRTCNDPLFNYHQWQANLRIIEVEEIKTIPYVPMSHPFVERLIGTIRREYLDHVLFWTSLDLERKLSEFKDYYNRHRAHSALPRDASAELAGEV